LEVGNFIRGKLKVAMNAIEGEIASIAAFHLEKISYATDSFWSVSWTPGEKELVQG
jgi:hypothetical protein